jgi:FKBP-type peptidyl-prolyl cis-trans isomerase FklB
MGRFLSVPMMTASTGLIVFLVSGFSATASDKKFDTDTQKEAYSLGVVVASQAVAGLGSVDEQAFVSGVTDVLQKNELVLSDVQISESLARFDERRAQEAQVALASMIESNRIEGDAFRKNFAEDPKVETLTSGLQYKVLENGAGQKPANDATVTIHYRGTLVDGREIDNSYSRKEPVTIQVDQVIPGWTEALTMMPVGSKWQVVLPPELAYGDMGAGEFVEPGSTVIFEMELISTS